MNTTRLEAFSDGVIAIIITIMVLELKVPHGTELKDITPLVPVLLAYLLSFVNVGIYWNNHHHMMHLATGVNGTVLWANLHLLFWLSLIPFVTSFMGENHFAPLPTAVYGVVLLGSGVAYGVLQSAIIRAEGEGSLLKQAVGRDIKGKLAPVLCIVAIVGVWLSPFVAYSAYVIAAMMWFVPDSRIEKTSSRR